jgi:hypothetical protein
MDFLNRNRETMFPALTSVSFERVASATVLSSTFLKRIRIRGPAVGVCISCPTCEVLDLENPKGITLNHGTEPKTMIFRHCCGFPSLSFENLAKSATVLTIVSLGPGATPDRPIVLPALRMLTILEKMTLQIRYDPLLVIAPRLEEVWHGGSLRSPPCDENGAYAIDLGVGERTKDDD